MDLFYLRIWGYIGNGLFFDTITTISKYRKYILIAETSFCRLNLFFIDSFARSWTHMDRCSSGVDRPCMTLSENTQEGVSKILQTCEESKFSQSKNCPKLLLFTIVSIGCNDGLRSCTVNRYEPMKITVSFTVLLYYLQIFRMLFFSILISLYCKFSIDG